jgi:hypothetical protein
MLFLKYSLTWGGIGMIAMATGILIYDSYREIRHEHALHGDGTPLPEPRMQWRASVALTLLAWGPLLLVAGTAA